MDGATKGHNSVRRTLIQMPPNTVWPRCLGSVGVQAETASVGTGSSMHGTEPLMPLRTPERLVASRSNACSRLFCGHPHNLRYEAWRQGAMMDGASSFPA